MAGTGAGKGSRPRKVDIKKYGKNFDVIFLKNSKNTDKLSAARMNPQLINSTWFYSQVLNKKQVMSN